MPAKTSEACLLNVVSHAEVVDAAQQRFSCERRSCRDARRVLLLGRRTLQLKKQQWRGMSGGGLGSMQQHGWQQFDAGGRVRTGCSARQGMG